MNRFFTLLLAASCLTSVGQAEYCGPGTYWDEIQEECLPVLSSDVDDDGCVDVADFLVHLSSFGIGCDLVESHNHWQCGMPVDYQGHTYNTVPIDNQCWFRENLTSEFYRNGDSIRADVDQLSWQALTYSYLYEGMTALYGEGETSCVEEENLGYEACDESAFFGFRGRLYNYFAVEDQRLLCPQGWHVPTNVDWNQLFENLGGTYLARWRMASMLGWTDGMAGTNQSGFSAVATGMRSTSTYNSFQSPRNSYWWSSGGSVVAIRGYQQVEFLEDLSSTQERKGYAVRCIQNAEDESYCNIGTPDAIGVCGGSCTSDEDGDGVCDDIDLCVGNYDDCGVCNGMGGNTTVIIEYNSVDTVYANRCWECGDFIEYNGVVYSTKDVGERCWFGENLRTYEYANGDPILSDPADSIWLNTSEGVVSNTSWMSAYGLHYNGHATVDERGLCPSGWHVPKHWEFEELITTSGEPENETGAIKDTLYWDNWQNLDCYINDMAEVSNATGLSFRPGGFRSGGNTSACSPASACWVGRRGFWWTTTHDSDMGTVFMLRCDVYGSIEIERELNSGCSVRCVKDVE